MKEVSIGKHNDLKITFIFIVLLQGKNYKGVKIFFYGKFPLLILISIQRSFFKQSDS
jgi:hypothetical protein